MVIAVGKEFPSAHVAALARCCTPDVERAAVALSRVVSAVDVSATASDRDDQLAVRFRRRGISANHSRQRGRVFTGIGKLGAAKAQSG
jgi:hypothetical protein